MTENQKIILALGTNKDQELNMFVAEHLLKKMLPNIVFSKSIWTRPIGMTSDKFLNEMAFGFTTHGTSQIERAIKHIERQCGSFKAERSKGIVRMDIDIMQIGETKYHGSDWKRNYIKELLKEDPYNLTQ